MAKEIVTTAKAPLPIGSYSQATRAGHLLFVSAIGAEDPNTGNVIKGDVEAQVRQSLRNIGVVLEAANMTLQDVVKVTVCLRDIGDWAKMNKVFGEFFKQNPPARTTIQAKMALKEMLVQVEAIAFA